MMDTFIGIARERWRGVIRRITRLRNESRKALVPRPLALIELADLLSQTKPADATTLYEQIKKEYPASAVSERADRGLQMLTPKS